MVKDHPFPSSGEYGQSFIIDIRPISYYSLLHKWLSPARASQTYNSIQIITENHIQNQFSVKKEYIYNSKKSRKIIQFNT